jgi:integrase
VAEWAQQWFEATEHSWKPKTRYTYRTVLDRLVLAHVGPVPLAQLRPIHVSKWVTTLSDGLSPSQVRQAYRLLAQILASAVDNGMIALSACRGVRLPRLPEANPRILTVDEVGTLVASCPELSDRVLVLLLAYGGLRIGRRSRCAGSTSISSTAGWWSLKRSLSFRAARSSTHRRITSGGSWPYLDS